MPDNNIEVKDLTETAAETAAANVSAADVAAELTGNAGTSTLKVVLYTAAIICGVGILIVGGIHVAKRIKRSKAGDPAKAAEEAVAAEAAKKD